VWVGVWVGGGGVGRQGGLSEGKLGLRWVWRVSKGRKREAQEGTAMEMQVGPSRSSTQHDSMTCA
jgi:hypothetical protein